MTVRGDVGEEANGLKDGVGSHGHAFGAFDDLSQREAQTGAAAREEPASVGVTIDGALGELVDLGDGARARPLQKFLFDLLALGVLAERALALVP